MEMTIRDIVTRRYPNAYADFFVNRFLSFEESWPRASSSLINLFTLTESAESVGRGITETTPSPFWMVMAVGAAVAVDRSLSAKVWMLIKGMS